MSILDFKLDKLSLTVNHNEELYYITFDTIKCIDHIAIRKIYTSDVVTTLEFQISINGKTFIDLIIPCFNDEVELYEQKIEALSSFLVMRFWK